MRKYRVQFPIAVTSLEADLGIQPCLGQSGRPIEPAAPTRQKELVQNYMMIRRLHRSWLRGQVVAHFALDGVKWKVNSNLSNFTRTL
jgi:hypothetical protein